MNQRLNTRATGLTHSLITAALLATTGLAAQAHQVWLEHSGSEARLHFGEYNDNLRETSPGLLDKFKGVPVLEQTVAGATQRVEGQLTKEAFTYTTAANAETLFADAAYPLIDRTKANLPPLLWKPHRPLGSQPGQTRGTHGCTGPRSHRQARPAEGGVQRRPAAQGQGGAGVPLRLGA